MNPVLSAPRIVKPRSSEKLTALSDSHVCARNHEANACFLGRFGGHFVPSSGPAHEHLHGSCRWGTLDTPQLECPHHHAQAPPVRCLSATVWRHGGSRTRSGPAVRRAGVQRLARPSTPCRQCCSSRAVGSSGLRHLSSRYRQARSPPGSRPCQKSSPGGGWYSDRWVSRERVRPKQVFCRFRGRSSAVRLLPSFSRSTRSTACSGILTLPMSIEPPAQQQWERYARIDPSQRSCTRAPGLGPPLSCPRGTRRQVRREQ